METFLEAGTVWYGTQRALATVDGDRCLHTRSFSCEARDKSRVVCEREAKNLGDARAHSMTSLTCFRESDLIGVCVLWSSIAPSYLPPTYVPYGTNHYGTTCLSVCYLTLH